MMSVDSVQCVEKQPAKVFVMHIIPLAPHVSCADPIFFYS